jgi:transposase-like protein
MKAKQDEVKARAWLERIAACKRSGLSRRAWCAQQGLNANTLEYWRRRLRGRAPAALVPVVVSGDGEASTGARIEIEASGVRLQVVDADATWLAKLLRALAC